MLKYKIPQIVTLTPKVSYQCGWIKKKQPNAILIAIYISYYWLSSLKF